MRKQLKLILVLFAIVLVALLYLLTTGKREISSEAIEEILASKSEAPDRSHTLLKGVSTVITQEIDKTDEHRRDRVDDLLVALKESPSLQHLLTYPDRTPLKDELFREYLKQIINWFLTTDPPSPEQRRQIEAQIDQIISTTTEFVLEMFPESKAQIEEMASNRRTSFMEWYNDALTPTLKRPLSPGEMEAISMQLEKSRHELKNHPFNDSHLEGKQNLFTEFAIGNLFASVVYPVDESYKLPMTERLIELENAVHEEFSQQAQARFERLSRESKAWSDRMHEEALKAMEVYDKAQLYGVNLQESAAPVEAGYNSESLEDIQKPSGGTLFPAGDSEWATNFEDDDVDNGNSSTPSNARMHTPTKERRNLNSLEEDVTNLTDKQFELLMERLQSPPAEASEKAFESDEALENEIWARQAHEFRQPPSAEPQEENPPDEEIRD